MEGVSIATFNIDGLRNNENRIKMEAKNTSNSGNTILFAIQERHVEW